MGWWTMYDLTRWDSMPHAEEKIENLPDFEIWKIRDETTSYIFENFWRNKNDVVGKFKEFLGKFDDIYYLSVSPFDIEKYKDNETIYDILKRYKHTAERRKLELMIFKTKEISEEEKQKIIKKVKKETWFDDIKFDETKYRLIVWYFGWTAWRTNSANMEIIKSMYPVKTLS